MRWLISFTITVIIYTILIWIYFINFKNIKSILKTKENRIKIDIRELSISKPTNKMKIKMKMKVKIKSIPKKVVSKVKHKVVHRKIKKIKKKSKRKVIKHITKRKIKKVVRKKINRRKKVKPRVKKNNFIPKSEIVYISEPLFNIDTDKNRIIPINNIKKKSKKSYPNSKIKRLYGKEFFSYTPKQKKFIEKNLSEIHKITQRVLWQRGYPGGIVSARTGQQGTNIVSFYLHPNGDISSLRLKKKVGYRNLDENTIETIKSAYKDYPYPTQTTKIVFFVEYSIFGY